jgi:poly(hydroxyalkanoate) depolymerase family esterase
MHKIIIFTMVMALASTTPFAQAGSMQVDGTKRDYTVYAPSSGLPTNPLLILALHALGQTAAQFRSSSGWDKIADKEKFVVVYPVGITTVDMQGQKLIGWDITANSDVHFLTALLDTMAARFKIDRKRVYSTGFSMGGMMSYVLACQVSDKITAIGPDAGYPVGQNASSCKPSVPVPVCHVHGADDNFVKVSDLPPWIKKFAEVDKCQSSPKTTTGAKYKKDDYSPCENGNEVICYTITGMAHAYATSSTNGFSATDTFWAFFKRHPASTGVANKASEIQRMQPVSAAYSGGKIHLAVNREINSVRIFDVHGRTIYTWKEPTRQVGDLTVPVGWASGGLCIINVTGPTGSSVRRVLIP